jgi:hypothetical protein
MHDIDRVQLENNNEFEQWESGPGSFGEAEAGPFQNESFEFNQGESSPYGEAESVFGEADEVAIASELLGVSTEEELDHFLGKLIRQAGQVFGRAIPIPAGQAIGSLLKGAARRSLPGIGAALGGYLGGSRGAQFGGQAASAAGRLFGLELEGLSGEDQEFEVARRFVRFSGEAVKNLTQRPPGRDLRNAARAATIGAAQSHAPGLLQPQGPVARPPSTPVSAGRSQSGRWTRRGNKIVLHGL